MKGYQPRTNLVKDENGAQLVESHRILNRWENYFCCLFNVHGVNDVWQIEVHTAASSPFEVKIPIENLKR
jgi:hypothetical protein